MSREMERFVDTMRKAFDQARDIPGISKIEWHITYTGTPEATSAIQQAVDAELAASNARKVLKEDKDKIYVS